MGGGDAIDIFVLMQYGHECPPEAAVGVVKGWWLWGGVGKLSKWGVGLQ